ncbi:MAG TPA: disulfide isomerase DsbC N-terminal domain-containing protein [Rhodanobacter sp.]|nr:disulfide isomerase DsbC N-terminal domain-containing protein [Rhodanobacter sp.]
MAKLSWLTLGMGVLALAVGAAQAQTAATAAVAPATSASAQAVSPAAQKMVRAAIASLSTKAQVDSIELAPLPGFYQVIASGQLLYVSSDGRYALNGDLLDLTAKRNVSDAAWARFRQRELARVPESARIVYAPKNPRYTVSVFTDVNCSFCRALHKHIAALNAAGIEQPASAEHHQRMDGFAFRAWSVLLADSGRMACGTRRCRDRLRPGV